MPGKLHAAVTIEVQGKTFFLNVSPTTTQIAGSTIPNPYRRRLDTAARSMIADLLEFSEEDS